MWSIHTMEDFSTFKRKEVLTHSTAWQSPEDIKLSEIRQSQKDTYCTFEGRPVETSFLHLYEEPRVVKYIGTEGGRWLSGGCGELQFNGNRVLVLQDEKFWR